EALLDPLEPMDGDRSLEDRTQRRAFGQLDPQLVAEGLEKRLARLDLLLAKQARAFEGALGEHPLTESVDGRDGSAIEDGERIAQATARVLVDGPGTFGTVVPACIEGGAELVAHALAHLAGRLVGERDDEDGFDRHLREDQLDDEVLERV